MWTACYIVASDFVAQCCNVARWCGQALTSYTSVGTVSVMQTVLLSEWLSAMCDLFIVVCLCVVLAMVAFAFLLLPVCERITKPCGCVNK